jgi:hypothetical protein
VSATKSRYPRPPVDQLDRLYTDLGLSCPDIGWLYERDPKTVFAWLRAAGIPTRSRGSNTAVHFRKGERSAFAGRRHSPESIARVRAASVARGAVPYLRNGQHWLKGAPPEANPNWAGGATPARQEFYRSPEWKDAVRYVWARDNACCRNCGKDWRTVDRAAEPTFHIHHVWSFQIESLRANPATLVLLCRDCHLWVHSKANVTRAWLPQGDDTAFPGLGDLIDAGEDVASIGRAEREYSMPSLFDTVEVAA